MSPPKSRRPARGPKKRKFVQVERVSTHDAVVDVVIMGIIEKHANDQSHYILGMNIVVATLLRAVSTSKDSPYNQFITHTLIVLSFGRFVFCGII